jgi:hypothetical protein
VFGDTSRARESDVDVRVANVEKQNHDQFNFIPRSAAFTPLQVSHARNTAKLALDLPIEAG